MAKKKRNTTRGKQAVVVEKRVMQPTEAGEVIVERLNKQIRRDGVKALPRGARVAISHALRDEEYSIVKIAETLGIDKNTAHVYINTEIQDKFIRYSDAVKKYMQERNTTLKSMTTDAIQNKLKDSDKESLRDLAGLYKILNDVEGVQRSSATNTGNVMTINVHPAMTRDDPIVISHNERDE